MNELVHVDLLSSSAKTEIYDELESEDAFNSMIMLRYSLRGLITRSRYIKIKDTPAGKQCSNCNCELPMKDLDYCLRENGGIYCVKCGHFCCEELTKEQRANNIRKIDMYVPKKIVKEKLLEHIETSVNPAAAVAALDLLEQDDERVPTRDYETWYLQFIYPDGEGEISLEMMCGHCKQSIKSVIKGDFNYCPHCGTHLYRREEVFDN